MKNFVCFVLLIALTSFAMANNRQKLQKQIAKREEVKELKREIARTSETRKK